MYPRHAHSWQVVQDHMDFKLWEVKTNELGDQTVLPELLPWLEEALDSVSFSRQKTEEGYVLYCCLPTVGVLSAAKQNFLQQLVTTFLAMHRGNAIAVVILPNKAGSART